jgi:peptidoglycan/xylan/chitin deacetylase (PgdA/CDA1 family)
MGKVSERTLMKSLLREAMISMLKTAMSRLTIRAMLLTFGIALSVISTRAASVVYVGSASADGTTLQQLETATQFYGLDLLTIRPEDGEASILKLIRKPETVAVVVDVHALSALNRDKLLGLGVPGHSIPMLIAGIQEGEDSNQLKVWSGGVISGTTHFDAASGGASYVVDEMPDVTRQLTGVHLPMTANAGTSLTVASGGRVILQASAAGKTFPVFARAIGKRDGTFFAAQIPAVTVPATSDPFRQQAVFASLAPAMMFLRYAAGNAAWHAPGNYANLTIDDLWLREPYGNVNYEKLLQEMELHKFHTTLAFVPWNYDRSQPKLVALFAAHPEMYSICIHGNDHIHQEFGPLATHPLAKQREDMRQAVARMEKFHTLTGIPYDRVMVFPHAVAPVATLAELKRANYLATANSLNVPSDSDPTSQVEVALRTTTLQYANFPSMRRYSAETDIPVSQLAIDSFLGNPILLYAHEGLFAGGMDRFDGTADTINRLEPATQWRSLGDIARHSYVERLRGNGNYDVRLFTAAADIRNGEDHKVDYSIEKTEDSAQPITVFVDGTPFPFQRSSGQLRLALSIGAGESRSIRIQYGDTLNVAAIDISKKSLSVAVIRRLSDFRDDVVSRSALGRSFIRSYVDDGPVWNRAAAIGIAVLLVALTLLLLRRRRGWKEVTASPASVAPSEQ